MQKDDDDDDGGGDAVMLLPPCLLLALLGWRARNRNVNEVRGSYAGNAMAEMFGEGSESETMAGEGGRGRCAARAEVAEDGSHCDRNRRLKISQTKLLLAVLVLTMVSWRALWVPPQTLSPLGLSTA